MTTKDIIITQYDEIVELRLKLAQQSASYRKELDSLRSELRKAKSEKREAEESLQKLRDHTEQQIEAIKAAAKPRLIYVDVDARLRGEHYDICKEYQRACEEIESLYKITNQLQSENAEAENKSQYAEEIVSLYEAEIESLKIENEELKRTNQQLRGQIISKNITINSFKDREQKPLIFEGVEADLFEGEQKDLILDILEERIKGLDPYTRQYTILKSLVEGNKKPGSRKKLKDEIYDFFRGYQGINALTVQQKRKMDELGFTVIHGNMHDKLLFKGDSRYMITIATTPKPSKRSGLNVASDIVRILL